MTAATSAPTGRPVRSTVLTLLLAAPFLVAVVVAAYHGIEHGRQERTLQTMRAVATAAEAYSIVHERYPAADSIFDLARVLQPTYTKALPTADGWHHPYEYAVPADGQHYRIRASMRDGRWEVPIDGYAGGPTDCGDWDSDVVFDTGAYVQWPARDCDGC